MGYKVIRFKQHGQIKWGVVSQEKICPIPGDYPQLSDFLKHGAADAYALAKHPESEATDIHAVEILNPVTPPCNIVCQGKNYAGHRKETGARPERPGFNLLFYKASSSLSPAEGQVICPSHVKLLDYELELGLVVGCDIKKPQKITQENLGEFVCGIVMANDISARDVQIPQEQWFKGKSYRSFCPVGPYLYMLEPSDINRLSDLQLTLTVNKEARQTANTKELLFSPAETLQEISEVMDLWAGDLILTGTPAGVSLQMPGRLAQKITAMLLSDQARMGLFVWTQLQNPHYLKNGDIIESTIVSLDGQIDLGIQKLEVVKY